MKKKRFFLFLPRFSFLNTFHINLRCFPYPNFFYCIFIFDDQSVKFEKFHAVNAYASILKTERSASFRMVRKDPFIILKIQILCVEKGGDGSSITGYDNIRVSNGIDISSLDAFSLIYRYIAFSC